MPLYHKIYLKSMDNTSVLKLAEEVSLTSQSMRKEAKKILKKKSSDAGKKVTHIFLHEKGISEIVSGIINHYSRCTTTVGTVRYQFM